MGIEFLRRWSST